MNIVFDYQTFCLQSYGGISRYISRLAEELSCIDIDVSLVAPIHKNRYLSKLSGPKVIGCEVGRYPPKMDRLFFNINRLASDQIVKRMMPDVVHETYYAAKGIAAGASAARVITVHDMIHELYPQYFNDNTSVVKKLAISRADHIICISENTKHDLLNLIDLPESKISVIHHGIDHDIYRDVQKSCVESVECARPFVLYVGDRWGYKNFGAFIRACSLSKLVKEEFNILCFGGHSFSSDEYSLFKACGLRDNQVVHMRGDDKLLNRLYSQATLFVYPSLYEGFGFPPLEAMANNCPVVASNTSCLPEVIGDAACFFDPYSIESMAFSIEKTLCDSDARNILVKNGKNRIKSFTWKKCAQETLDVYARFS